MTTTLNQPADLPDLAWLTIDVDETTDLSRAGVLTAPELEQHAFRCGLFDEARPGLHPGDQVADLAHPLALVYGHVPPHEAIRAAATHLGDLDPDQHPEVLHRHAAGTPTWVVFTLHRPTCTTGGDPANCGCAPADDPDGHWVTGATEGTPGAVPVTPVVLPDRA